MVYVFLLIDSWYIFFFFFTKTNLRPLYKKLCLLSPWNELLELRYHWLLACWNSCYRISATTWFICFYSFCRCFTMFVCCCKHNWNQSRGIWTLDNFLMSIQWGYLRCEIQKWQLWKFHFYVHLWLWLHTNKRQVPLLQRNTYCDSYWRQCWRWRGVHMYSHEGWSNYLDNNNSCPRLQ